MYFVIGLAVVISVVVMIVMGASMDNFRRAANEPDETKRRIKTEAARKLTWQGVAIAIAVIVAMLLWTLR